MPDRYLKVLRGTCFRNAERWEGSVPIEQGQPNWSNSKVTIHTAIPAGTYGLSIWQYVDSGNVSFDLTRDTQPPAPDKQPEDSVPKQGSIDDDFDL
jgi:hypothetical protein